MNFKYFSKNGEMLPIEQAVIPLSNIEYQYGFGVYESIRVIHEVPYFQKDHIERLQNSARIIGLEHPFSEEEIEKGIAALIQKSGAVTYNLKILLVGGRTAEDASLFIVPLNPHFPDKKLYRDGVPLITYHYERPFPHAKTLNMLQSYLAYKKAREANCYDALLVDPKGFITEGTRTNFFCIQGRTLISPPESNILPGVTRKAVIEVAKKNGFAIEEKNIPLEEIADPDTTVGTGYDGAFITSTSSKILPVRSIDSNDLREASSELRELMRAYDAFLDICNGRLS